MKAKPPPARGSPAAKLPLPFSGFLDLLKRRGFAGGVDRHLRLVALLERIGGDCRPEELKQLIAPLFATNDKEQKQFYRVFKDYFPLLESPPKPEQNPSIEPTRIPEEGQAPSKTRRIVSWGTGIAALAALLIFLGPSLPKKKDGKGPQPTPTASPTPRLEVSATPGVTPPPMTPMPSQTPFVLPAAAPQTKVMSFLIRNRTALMWIGGLFPLFLFGADEWRRFAKRRQLVLERTRGRKPPFTWPIRIEPRRLAYLNSEQFYKVARKLRRRQIAEYHRLDLARTIDATIAASGYPTFQYRPDSRMPEYLILIDRGSARDHQAALFDQLAQALQREGIFITRYFFDGDPRICWSERATASVNLGDLQKTFSEHRVLLFGRGERLIDPVSGELAEWSSLFLEWPDRAVVTPAAPSDWNQRENTLAEQFLVFPATLEGIEQLAERFDSSVPAELEVSEADDRLPPDLERNPDIGELRTYLGEPVFQWLCACAIYPELHWDLTLLLGSLPEIGERLVTERNLLRLARLPWFRAGAIPDEQRLQLIATLDPGREQAVRAAIVRTLERSPAPEASFAAESRRLEIVVQEGLLGHRSTSELRSALRSMPVDEVTRNYVLLHETRRISPLVFAVPERIRSLLFEKGIAGLALNRFTRLGLTSAAIAVSLLAIAFLVPEQNTTAVVIGISEYPESPLQNAANDARKFEAALRNGTGARLVEKQSAFLYDQEARAEAIKTALGQAFQPDSYAVSTLWIVIMVVVAPLVGLVGGWVCAAISKSKRACMAFAIVVFLGLIVAIPEAMKEHPNTARSGDVSSLQAMQMAQTPTWLLLLNPVLSAAGVLLGVRIKKLPVIPPSKTRSSKILKSILGVIVGYIVMVIFSFAIYTGAYLGLGVDRVFERSGPTDRIFYFAGHGGANPGEQSLTLFPVNQLDDEGAKPFTSAELMEFVKPALARGDRVFLFIDTAYAGVAGSDVNRMVTQLATPRGSIFAFFSANPTEVSLDSSAVSGSSSPFTFFLLRGWQGAADANNNGTITLLELMGYVRDNVLAATGNTQRPFFAGNGLPETVLPLLFGPKIFQGEKITMQTEPPIQVSPPPIFWEFDRDPSPTPKTEAPERAAVGDLPGPAADASPTPAPDQYQTPVQPAQTTAAPFSPAQQSPAPAFPTPTPSPTDGPGGIDIESAGTVSQRSRDVLSGALATEGFKPRRWDVGDGPQDRILVKHYLSTDSDKAERIRAALVRLFPQIRVEVPTGLNPPRNYRPGHVDIWLPAMAVKRLLEVK